jgi:hypothetical protein
MLSTMPAMVTMVEREDRSDRRISVSVETIPAAQRAKPMPDGLIPGDLD